MVQGEKSRARCLISGRVQGVAYRAHAREVAAGLGLLGYVRNLPDGRVEVVAEGSREAVVRLIEWCKDGPAFARVDGVEVDWMPPAQKFNGFEIKYY